MIPTLQLGQAGRSHPANLAGDLDALASNLYAAYSIERKLSTYNGPAFKVRRSSDSATMEVQFLADNTANIGTMLQWAGSATVTLELWYDQTGNGRALNQGTSADQPRIATGGVYDGFVRFDGSNDHMQSLTTFGGGVPSHSIAWHGQTRSNLDTFFATMGDINSENGWYALGLNVSGSQRLRAGVGDANATGQFVVWNGTTEVLTTEAAWLLRYDRSQSTASNYAAWKKAWRNGVEETFSHVTTTGGGPVAANFTNKTLNMGSNGIAGFGPLNMKSLAVWSVNQDANAAAICTAIA